MLVNFGSVLGWHVVVQLFVFRGEVVGEDIWSAHKLTILVNDNRDGPGRINLQVVCL